MSRPRQCTAPAAGGVRPHRMRSRLLLPLPLAPATHRASPGATARSMLENRVRPPRTQAMWWACRVMVERTIAGCGEKDIEGIRMSLCAVLRSPRMAPDRILRSTETFKEES